MAVRWTTETEFAENSTSVFVVTVVIKQFSNGTCNDVMSLLNSLDIYSC